jgi:hypothetical protein
MPEDYFKAIIGSLPDKKPRSRLEPYGNLIEQLRKLGWTYREIERILSEKCGIHAPRCTINDFVRRRRRWNVKVQKSRALKVENTNLPPIAIAGEIKSTREKNELQKFSDTYKRIEALRQRVPKPIKTSDLFHYNPDEPLHLPKDFNPKKTGE